MADCVGNGSKNAYGCGEHDDVRELEHRFRKTFGKTEHGAALRFGDESESHGEEDAEYDDLEDLVFGDGFSDVFREDVDDELGGAVRSGVKRFGRGGGRKMHAFAGAADVDGGEADKQGDGGNDFEVDERFEAKAADFLQIGMASDTYHEGAEEERRNDYADQAKEDSP